MVRKRAHWILAHASQITVESLHRSSLSAGRRCRTWAATVRMVVESGDVRSPEVRFDHWRFRVIAPWSLHDGKRYEAIRRAIVTWYRIRAAERLAASVDRWWPRLGRGEKSRILDP